MENNNITRKEAIKKIGNYSKYAALTAMGTYIMLHPKSAQAFSALPEAPSDDGFFGWSSNSSEF